MNVISWSGNIPSHWKLSPLRFLASFIGGATPDTQNTEYWSGQIPWVSPKDMKHDLIHDAEDHVSEVALENSALKIVEPTAVLIVVRGMILAHSFPVAVNTVPVTINQDMKALICSEAIEPTFLVDVLKAAKDHLVTLADASAHGTKKLETEVLGRLEIPVPPIDEQRKIVYFLDREVGDIETLIAAKQRLLDLLAEKRRVIVAEAVMRGINPSAPLRPSGIDWLGDIPAHWEVCHLKRVLAHLDYGTSDATDVVGSIAILRMGDIRDGELDFSKLAYLDQVEDGLLLQEGDLVFNRTNSLDQIGKVALFRGNVDFPVSFASYLVRLRCEKTALPEYLNWVLNSSYALAWARAEALPSIGQANLNPNRYGYLPIALPPLEEQPKITKYLAESVARLDGIRAATEHSITLLKERRGALIAAAVTGQIDIPEAA
jgi:type I restriction enzyme S subunit